MHAHAADAQQLAHVAPPEAADAPAEAAAAPRGRARHRCRAAAASASSSGCSARAKRCSTRLPVRAARARRGRARASAPGPLRPKRQVRAVGDERQRRQRCGGELQAVCSRAPAPRISAARHQVQQVRAGRDPESPGANSRVTAAPPSRSPPRAPAPAAAARQVGRADQSVVTAADDDAVVAARRDALTASRPRSRRMARAALAPGRAHDAAARVGARAAHVHAAHRRAVLRIAGNRAVEQQLIEGELALEDVALGEARPRSRCPRACGSRRAGSGRLKSGLCCGNGIDHRVAERLALLRRSTRPSASRYGQYCTNTDM